MIVVFFSSIIIELSLVHIFLLHCDHKLIHLHTTMRHNAMQVAIEKVSTMISICVAACSQTGSVSLKYCVHLIQSYLQYNLCMDDR